jgi:hypothetical protein
MKGFVEGTDKTSGGAYHHNCAGGFLDASAYLDMEEEAVQLKKTEGGAQGDHGAVVKKRPAPAAAAAALGLADGKQKGQDIVGGW